MFFSARSHTTENRELGLQLSKINVLHAGSPVISLETRTCYTLYFYTFANHSYVFLGAHMLIVMLDIDHKMMTTFMEIH